MANVTPEQFALQVEAYLSNRIDDMREEPESYGLPEDATAQQINDAARICLIQDFLDHPTDFVTELLQMSEEADGPVEDERQDRSGFEVGPESPEEMTSNPPTHTVNIQFEVNKLMSVDTLHECLCKAIHESGTEVSDEALYSLNECVLDIVHPKF